MDCTRPERQQQQSTEGDCPISRHRERRLSDLAGFDDRYVNNFMGPSAQKHTIDDLNADNFDHAGAGFIRGAQLSIGTPDLEGGPLAFMNICCAGER
jgi:hypothetical protein